MLYVNNITKNFGGLQALSDVTVPFREGQFIGLIGPNGSGKTTLLNCISGLYAPDSGTILLDKTPLTGLKPHRIYHMGIGRTFQISKVFNRLTVLDNLSIPALTQGTKDRSEILERAEEILDTIQLTDLKDSYADNLSGGQKKLLEIGMIMMTDPEYLLLDEPFGGVHPELKIQLESYLIKLHENGKTIILVSHEIPSVFRTCQWLVVLDHGVLITEGEPENVRNDERVINAYLGGARET